MTPDSSRGQWGRAPKLQHHLEDPLDRILDRRLGAGRATRRRKRRRDARYEHLARELFDQLVEHELDRAGFEDPVLESVEIHHGAALMTVYVAIEGELPTELNSGSNPEIHDIESRLRAELVHHLPRRNVPAVRLRFTAPEAEW